MNLQKARDFYSAYYEGNLDEGLKQAFERAMSLDSTVAAEYRQFERVMQALAEPGPEIEIPTGLHLKIRERVDASIQEAERDRSASRLFFAWRPIAYGALATVAIIGAVLSISSSKNKSNVSTAGIIGSGVTAPRIVVESGQARLVFRPSQPVAVNVSNASTNEWIQTINASNQPVNVPVANKGTDTLMLKFEFSGQYETIYLVLPGTRSRGEMSGSGTLHDVVMNLASVTRTPIVLTVNDTAKTTNWSFESLDPNLAIEDEVKELGLRAVMKEEGLLSVSSD